MTYSVMGTGSRSMLTADNAFEIYTVLRYKILLLAEEHPDLLLITGMAEGWDEAIAKIGMRESIPYHCYLPNPDYGKYYWGKKSLLGIDRMEVFYELINAADDVKVCCDSLYENGEHANFIRNRIMIADADEALVYETGSRGTAHAIRILKANNLPCQYYPFETLF